MAQPQANQSGRHTRNIEYWGRFPRAQPLRKPCGSSSRQRRPPVPPSRLPNRSSAARRGETAGIRKRKKKKKKRPIAGLKISAISPGRLSDDSCSAEPMLSQLGAVMIDELPPAVAAPAPQLGVGRHHPLRRHHGQDAFPHAAAPIVDSPIFSLCPRWVLCEVFPAPPGSRVTFCIPRRN